MTEAVSQTLKLTRASDALHEGGIGTCVLCCCAPWCCRRVAGGQGEGAREREGVIASKIGRGAGGRDGDSCLEGIHLAWHHYPLTQSSPQNTPDHYPRTASLSEQQ